MLTKIHGKHCFECDSCADTLSTDTTDFTEALKIMRQENWQARKIGTDWVHTCFGCDEEAREAHRKGKPGRHH